MSSPFDHIAELTACAAAARIETLELVGPDGRLSISLRADDAPLVSSGPEAAAAPAADATGPAPHGVRVRSPGIGRLLLAHPLRDEPLAPEGACVAAGQPLALLAVGALLVPVPSPSAGTIRSVLRDAGALVGYGDALFDLHPQP